MFGLQPVERHPFDLLAGTRTALPKAWSVGTVTDSESTNGNIENKDRRGNRRLKRLTGRTTTDKESGKGTNLGTTTTLEDI